METLIPIQSNKRESEAVFHVAGRYVRFCKYCGETFRTDHPHGKKCPDCKRKTKEKSRVKHYFHGVF